MISFLHTSSTHIERFERLVQQFAPHLTTNHFVNETLLEIALNTGVLDEEKFEATIINIQKKQPQLIICTCSTYGELCDNFENVLRVDAPIAQYLVTHFKKIALVFTANSTKKVSRDLLNKIAINQNYSIQIIEYDCSDSWFYFENQNMEMYEKSIAQSIEKIAKNVDVVFLAQASMQGVKQHLEHLKTPVFCSTDFLAHTFQTMMNKNTRVSLKNVSINIGSKTLLQQINWTIKTNENWVISGDRGVGKTILAQALAGKHRLTTGTRNYPFLGQNPSFEARRTAIQIVSFTDTSKLFKNANAVHYYQQRFNAFEADGHFTVRQYLVKNGLNINEEKQQKRLQTIGINDLLDKDRIKLSSGQTRKLLLAKVLLNPPKILILDNPYIGLDKKSRQILNDLLDHIIQETEMTLIISGHYETLPKCMTHSFHIIDNQNFKQSQLNKNHQQTNIKKINNTALNAIKKAFKEKKYAETFKDIIRFENVNIKYGNTHILKNLNWQVKSGEKWSVYGQNGSGKSTVLSLVYADNPQAYANSIYLFDKRRGRGESIWDIKKRIGFTSPELHAYFNENLTAEKVVLTGLSDTFTILRKPSEAALAFSDLLFDYFGMREQKQTPFHFLSTGTQRLLFLMRALVKIPPVLLLDEPFQGMDQTTIEQATHLINQIIDDRHTVLFISHFKNEIPNCVKHILNL